MPNSLTATAEARAVQCVRIASALMPQASAIDVEDKAMLLMDLEDDQLKHAIEVITTVHGETEDEDVEKGIRHVTARLDKLENSMNRLVAAMTDFFASSRRADAPCDDPDEAEEELLKAMLTEMDERK